MVFSVGFAILDKYCVHVDHGERRLTVSYLQLPNMHHTLLSTNRHAQRLARIYDAQIVPTLARRLDALIERYRPLIKPQRTGWSERDAMLISYADTLQDAEMPPIRALGHFLQDHVGDAITLVHLLPFYPYTSDDGFAVEDFRSVREDLGSWEDIHFLSRQNRLAFDAVINHVSISSQYFKGYAAGDPRYAEFMVSIDPETDTSSVLRTRDLPLLHSYPTAKGTEWLWTTFSQDQVDLNYANPEVLLEIVDVLLFYAQQGASVIRLDAIPYLWKKLGTSCAHLPETHEIIKLFRDIYDDVAPHVLLLSETNVPHQENLSYFGECGDEAQMIYNFSLAPLIVWSVLEGNACDLTNWASGLEHIGPRATYLNITATHDGIGMRPTEGILSEDQRQALIQMAYDRGGDVSGKRNADGTISPYELNISYFDAINDPNAEEPIELQVRRFMLSQAIPAALLGVPGIYIQSLLGSRNDTVGVESTGCARSINRPKLKLQDLERSIKDPSSLRAKVWHAYRGLLRKRQRHSAFHPDANQRILEVDPAVFAVLRHNLNTGERILAVHNVSNRMIQLDISNVHYDFFSEEAVVGASVKLLPYQVRWLAGR